MTKLDTGMCMISIIWSISGIQSGLALTKGMKYNSEHFCRHVIPDIRQNIYSSSRIKTLKDILLHLDNAPVHNSRLSSEKIESTNPQRMPHPPYGPDRVPSDFFLFSYLRETLRRRSFSTSDDLIFAIRPIFSEIPEMGLKDVLTNWIAPLAWVMKKSGEY
jgi:histone-lysine N-methyltransferase SETMAR